MKWSLRKLAALGKPVVFCRTLALSRALISRDAHLILSASPVKVNATVGYRFDRAVLTAHVRVTLVVPSSRSLIPVKLPLNFRFQEVYVTSRYALKRYERNHPHGDTALLIGTGGVIDFNRAVVDNVILQIPSKVLSKRERQRHLMPHGQGWRVISEDDYHHSKTESHQIDPRLAKLKNYFSKK